MGRCGDCRCASAYFNIRKFNANTGHLIWQRAIPATGKDSTYSHNTDIVALSDGGFAVNNSAIGVCRINSGGKVIKQQPAGQTQSPIHASDNSTFMPCMTPKMSVKQGTATPNDNGDPDISDLIYVAAGAFVYCLDANLEIVWRGTMGLQHSIKFFDGSVYALADGFDVLRKFDGDTGDEQTIDPLRWYDLNGNPTFAFGYLLDVGENGLLVTGGNGFQTGIMSFPLEGGIVTDALFIGQQRAQIPAIWLPSGEPLIRQFNNLVKGVGESFRFLNQNWLNDPQHYIYPEFLLGYSELTPNAWAGGFAVLTQIANLDGGVICTGSHGWLYKDDSHPPAPDDATDNVNREYKNIWCFNSDGSLRWTHPETYDVTYGSSTSYGFPDGNGHTQGIPPDGTGAQYYTSGVAIGADGNPVVTSLSIPVRKQWRSTARIDTQTFGHIH